MVAREHASPAARQCDVVVDLFSGPMGACRLGYVKSGADAGRVVLLRDVSPKSVRLLGRRLRKACEIADSNLVKLLGTVEADGRVQIASEYVAGVSLFELRAAATEKREKLEPEIATRIIASAVKAAKSAHALCQAKGFELTRCIFSDTIWIAEFGETMLTDVGLADLLGSGGIATTLRTSHVSDGPGSHDVFAAGVELYELLSGKPFTSGIPSLDASTPPPLAALVHRALSSDEKRRFASVSELSAAFSQLPRELVAHEDRVTAAVERLMKTTLKLRRAKLSMLERTLGTQDDGESTRCYSTASLRAMNQSDTVRPAPSENSNAAALPGLRFPEDLFEEAEAETSAGVAGKELFQAPVAEAEQEAEEEEATRIMRPLAVPVVAPNVELKNPEAGLPTIHVREVVAARRAVTVMMRTPLVGAEDPTLRNARKADKPKRLAPVLALCVLALLAAMLAVAATNPQRIGGFLRAAGEAAAPKR